MENKSLLMAIEAIRSEECERCAQIAENFPDQILQFFDRPGGPPGNYYRKSTRDDIAAAIRAAHGQSTED